MKRLALAKTIVTGTVTLQGRIFTFTASGSGKATGNNVSEAKKSAIGASNAAAIIAARASIDTILTNNSAVLTDLEITSLISNNLSTTVVVFRPIALKFIATTKNGINYVLKPNQTVRAGHWVTVPTGITLIGEAGNNFINYGFIQIEGTFTIGVQSDDTTISTDYTNTTSYQVDSGGTLTIIAGVTFTNVNFYADAYISNYGTTINNGTIRNDSSNSNIYTYSGSTFTNNGDIFNEATFSYLKNNSSAIFTNNGTFTNSGSGSFILNNKATFYNNGSVINYGPNSYSRNCGTWIGDGECTGSCCKSGCYCA
jgi:hypothetical protein